MSYLLSKMVLRKDQIRIFERIGSDFKNLSKHITHVFILKEPLATLIIIALHVSHESFCRVTTIKVLQWKVYGPCSV